MQGPVKGVFEQNFVTFCRENITPNSTCLGKGYRNSYNLIDILEIKPCGLGSRIRDVCS